MKSKVIIKLKDSVLDPQGTTVHHALENLGYDSVKGVRIGKVVEVEFDSTDEAAVRKQTEEMCEKLLANTVIESYEFEVISE